MIEFREAVLEMETEKRSIPPKLPLDSLIMKAYQDSVHRILILGGVEDDLRQRYLSIHTQ